MKILVPCKRVPDPDQKLRLNADATDVDATALTYILNPFDAIAVEEALCIRETAHPEAEIIAVSIAPAEGEDDLRTALAMGADRALLVEHNTPLDSWNVARLLAAVVEREQPALVIMGKQAVDDDANQAGQMLAAILGWPQATFASAIQLNGGLATVSRETDDGIETVRVSLPAVITVDLRLNEPRYASLPSIMKARKKPVQKMNVEQLGIELEPRVELLALETVTAARSCHKVGSAQELLAVLQDDAKLI